MRRLVFLLLILAGCSGKADNLGVPSPENRAEPKTDEERLVAEHIKKNVSRPETVSFSRWGPNRSGESLLPVWRKAGIPLENGKPGSVANGLLTMEKVVRVRYSHRPKYADKDEEVDGVYWIKGSRAGTLLKRTQAAESLFDDWVPVIISHLRGSD